MKINREGYAIISVAFCLMAAISVACFLFTPQWVAWLVFALLLAEFIFIITFFREPKRERLTDDKFVYAPADGKVVVIEEVEEREYLGERMMQISVFMSLTDVHINWFPVGGTVEYFKYHPGRFLVAWHPKSSEENERTTVVINTGKHKVLFRQIAGILARRIVSYAEVGKHYGQNEKSGFIKFGSRVDVLIPADSEILVKMNEQVVGSQTPIAKFK